MNRHVFHTLDEIFESGCRRGLIVGFEQTFPTKSYNFSPFRNIVHYGQHLFSLFSKKAFIHHEVIHKHISTRKVVFDIDMKGGSLQLYQEVQDKLITSLLSILPDLDLESEIVICTSHSSNKFSGHVILQRTVDRDQQDLAHLYKLVKENMHELFQYIDPAFQHFSHNLRMLGSTKEGRTKVFNHKWRYQDREIHTNLPKAGYREDHWEKNDSEDFYAHFTTFEETQTLSPFIILSSTFLSEDHCPRTLKKINFNLPPPEEKKIHFEDTASISEETIWQDLLLSKYPEYAEQFSPQGFNSKGLFQLQRIQSGHCVICERVHDKIGAYIFIKGKEQTVLLGCPRAIKQYKRLGCLKPELQEAGGTYVPYVPPPLQADIVYEENHCRPLPTKGIVCLKARMGGGKTKRLLDALAEIDKPGIRGIAIGPRRTFDTGMSKRLNFTSYLDVENQSSLHHINKLVVQLESLWKVGERWTGGKTLPAAKYNYAILDEAVSIKNQFFSETMAKSRQPCFETFKHLLSTIPLIYILDADLDQPTIDWFAQFRPREDFTIIHNTSLPEERIAKVVSVDNFFHTMREMRKQGLKTGFVSYKAQTIIDEEVELKKESSHPDYYSIYHSQSNEQKKKEDFANVNSAWSKVKHILYSSTCSVGISYEKEDFDYLFVLAGPKSVSMRELRQMTHRIRFLKNKTIYVAFEKAGENKAFPSLDRLAEEMHIKYLRGVKNSPSISAMPRELRTAYLEYKHEKLRTDLACRGEFYRLFGEMNYKFEEEEEDAEEVPKYESLQVKVDLEEIRDREKAEDVKEDPVLKQLKTEREVFSTWVDFDLEDPSEAANELFKKRKSKYKYIKRASIEKAFDLTEQALYIFNKRDKKAIWYELSGEEKLRYQVVSRLNQLLQIPHSFAGREASLSREELTGPILSYLLEEKELIQGLYRCTISEDLRENPGKVQIIVNHIYKDWTGLGKKLKVGEKERISQKGQRVTITPYSIEEVRIGDVPFWDLIKDRGDHRPREDDPELDDLLEQVEEHKKEKRARKTKKRLEEEKGWIEIGPKHD